MNKSFARWLLAIVVLLSATSVMAQVPQLTVPWNFGFEPRDSAILQNWHINDGMDTTRCKERWVVNNYMRSEGNNSLYITNDGLTNEYGLVLNTAYAYFDFTLPAGQYELSFDWLCVGGKNSYLCAGVGIASQMNDLRSGYSFAFVDTKAEQFALPAHRRMFAQSKWQNTSIEINSNGNRVFRMYFAWANSNNDSLPNMVGAAVDNIQITTRNCAKPRDVQAELRGDSVYVTWKGTSEQYCLEYRKYGRTKWSVRQGIYTNEAVIEGLDEGAYDFRVRGVCNTTDTSAYAYKNAFGIYYPDRHCIDYVNLRDNENIIATSGTFRDPYMTEGVVDEENAGLDPRYWRHVVNWDPDEYDPRTGYRLKIVPNDEVASVRLGNWNSGTQGESLSFYYTVDAENAAILLVKYAVVLEDPNHSPTDQPHFNLEILDEWGEVIDATCGTADFYADSKRAGWNTYGNVTWKDWTVIGLNLTPYANRTLEVRLTTRDCSLGAHFGYAYFTINCAAAKITGTSCGDDAQMSIAAPSGFNYVWYDKYDKVVPNDHLSLNKQTLLVDPSDTTTYRCHLSYLEDTTCGFDLYSRCLPRFPIASYDWEYIPSDCQNKVRFTNKSHIMTKFNNVIEYHEDQPCDEFDWDFGFGMTSAEKSPVMAFPNSGGRFPVTLYSYIAEGRCFDDTTIYIDLPMIGDTVVHRDTSICEGSYVTLGPLFCGLDSTYDYTWKTAVGCDSTVYLTVHVRPVTSEYVGDTTICAEAPLVIDGQRYKQFPESGQFYRFYRNQYGCDSTLWMNVTVMDSIKPTIEVTDLTSGVASGEIKLGGTGYDYYLINGEKNGQTTGLGSGIYQLEFYNDFGCSLTTARVIGFDPLQLSADTLTEICGDSMAIYVPFEVSGTPISPTLRFHYKMWFDDNAIAAGFTADTIAADMPLGANAFEVALPTGVKAGYYTVYVEADNELAEPLRLQFVIRVNFSAGVVFQRWGDVLSVYSREVIGDSVASFQWMRGGEDIDGATKSYYYADGGLVLNVPYQVRLTMSDGSVLYTCEVYAVADPTAIQIYPTMVAKGGAVSIQVPESATLQCFTPQGVLIDTRSLSQGVNSWTAPSAAGVYVLIINVNGEIRNFRICVTE